MNGKPEGGVDKKIRKEKFLIAMEDKRIKELEEELNKRFDALLCKMYGKPNVKESKKKTKKVKCLDKNNTTN